MLFKVVTAYGESSLKAPTSINGRYRLYTQNPNCLKSNAQILAIQQSGIYLNGSLLPASTDVQQLTIAEQKPSLTGQMNNNQISLAGRVPSSVLCHHTVADQTSDRLPNNSPTSVKIQSQVLLKSGKIQLAKKDPKNISSPLATLDFSTLVLQLFLREGTSLTVFSVLFSDKIV